MSIPKDVEAYGVHAERLAELNALIPIGLRDTRVVKLGGLHNKGLTVEQERTLASLE